MQIFVVTPNDVDTTVAGRYLAGSWVYNGSFEMRVVKPWNNLFGQPAKSHCQTYATELFLFLQQFFKKYCRAQEHQ